MGSDLETTTGGLKMTMKVGDKELKDERTADDVVIRLNNSSGSWIINPWCSPGTHIKFIMKGKPNRWKRFWHKFTLGWEWEDH